VFFELSTGSSEPGGREDLRSKSSNSSFSESYVQPICFLSIFEIRDVEDIEEEKICEANLGIFVFTSFIIRFGVVLLLMFLQKAKRLTGLLCYQASAPDGPVF
jgi:hypothetical protein